MNINLTKRELQALIQRSSRHTGIKDSKAFTNAYDKLLSAWHELRAQEKEGTVK